MKKPIKTFLILVSAVLLAHFCITGAWAVENGSEKTAAKIAVLDFEARFGLKKETAEALSEALRQEIRSKGTYEVLDQETTNRLLAGQRCDLSTCTTGDCFKAMGQSLGVSKIVTGAVSAFGDVSWNMSFQLIDASTGKLENVAEDECRCSLENMFELGRKNVTRLLKSKTPPAIKITAKRSDVKGVLSGTEFVHVKGGCFKMGDIFGDGFDDQKPAHEVCLDDFYMGKYNVTRGDFRKFVEATGYKTEGEESGGCFYMKYALWYMDNNKIWSNPGYPQDDNHPVVCVTYRDASAYADWLSKQTGKAIRLPTEAEWEYAARSGGKDYMYSWGDNSPAGNVADESAGKEFPGKSIWEGYDDGFAYSSPVGTYAPNELGLYDMTGNVWVWTSDFYSGTYYGESPKNNPKGPDKGNNKVIRGGAWIYNLPYARTTFRYDSGPIGRCMAMGFRIVYSAK